jgi:hypothetical protein
MNKKEDLFEGHWLEIKNRIRMKWSRLNGTELESLKHNLDCLVARIEASYGCAKARAELEYHEFRLSLRPLLQPSFAVQQTKA